MDCVSSPAAASIPPEVFEMLRTIAEPSRVRVIEFLGGGERCVCEIGSALGLSPALASHHLRVLRSSGLIRERRAGRWVYYSLDADGLEQVRQWVDRLLTSSTPTTPGDPPTRCGVDLAPTQSRVDHPASTVAAS